MWQYIQRTGELLHNWGHVAFGYSGHGEGKNNPEMQQAVGIGPIPCGTYRIGKPYDHPKLGPHVMNLDPVEGTATFGRSEFRMHGDSISDPGSASHGCVVMNRIIRNKVSESGDDLLRVIAEPLPDALLKMPVSTP